MSGLLFAIVIIFVILICYAIIISTIHYSTLLYSTLLYSTLLFLAAEVAVPSANLRDHVFECLISTLLELQKVVLSAENDLP